MDPQALLVAGLEVTLVTSELDTLVLCHHVQLQPGPVRVGVGAERALVQAALAVLGRHVRLHALVGAAPVLTKFTVSVHSFCLESFTVFTWFGSQNMRALDVNLQMIHISKSLAAVLPM